jgi:non-specific serine/threonine protein kinase/serine/threonine-protein kinase
MEYVQGVPITEYCDRNRLPNRERMRLFVQVCQGVQHAHQKAILHRDLKPSNVLVTLQDNRPVPKIIDFGLAKATAQRLTEKSMYTERGILIGTPEYMSPEQAGMTAEGVDTRTDVYALGVILYELLVGALPFDPADFRRAGFEAILRKLREEEPPKPSVRLSSLGEGSSVSAKHHGVDLRTLRGELRGDLDWITMKALEKDRTRRYGSPAELAADVVRHMKDEPVLAGPPSTAYRAGKFVRRHRAGVTVAAASVVVLAGFAVTMAVQARRIAAEREASDRVSEFLANMLGDVKPQVLGGALWDDLHARVAEAGRLRDDPPERITAALASLDDALEGVNPTDTALRLLDEQVLSRAARTVETQLANEPRIAGRLECTLSVTYRRIGLYPQAERHALRSLELLRPAVGEEHPDTLDAMNSLAVIYDRQRRYDEAERVARTALEAERRVQGSDHPDTLNALNNLANICQRIERYDEAEALHLESLETRRRVAGPEHPDTLKAANNLANVWWSQGRLAEAEKLHSETLEIRRRVLSPDDLDTPSSMHNLANVYRAEGRIEDAERSYREAFETRKRLLGETHSLTLDDAYSVACMAARRGNREDAMHWLRQAVEHGYKDIPGSDSMTGNSDLDLLRGDPAFDALVARALQNAGARP